MGERNSITVEAPVTLDEIMGEGKASITADMSEYDKMLGIEAGS